MIIFAIEITEDMYLKIIASILFLAVEKGKQ